jgi:uncharacterized lipoprotein YmbA
MGLAHGPDVEIVHTVALEGTGVAEVLAAARRAEVRGRDAERSAHIWATRLREMLRDRLLDDFSAEQFLNAGREVAAHRCDPYTILNEWIKSKD